MLVSNIEKRLLSMPENSILYIKNNLKAPIVLVGMMGVGKSSIGQALAHRLGWKFGDSDKMIEDKAGMPVADIFSEFGELKFRAVEKSTILDLLKHEHSVVSTGGGAVMDEETMEAIKNRGLSIWLQADLDYIFDRVSKNDNRPLLRTDDPKRTLAELMEKRRPYYEKADLALDTTQNSVDVSADELLQLIYRFLNRT